MEVFSFKKGFSQVMQKDISNVKHEIMITLGITTNVAWLNRLNGKVEPKVSEAKAIEETFAKYGIKEVWGELYERNCNANKAGIRSCRIDRLGSK